MKSLTYSRIHPRFELRSSLLGSEKPFSENWTMGNESSSFVSDSLHILYVYIFNL